MSKNNRLKVQYQERQEKMRIFIDGHFDMPNYVIENLIGFLRQNNGRLSKRARIKEFEPLTDEEVDMLEEKYQEVFRE